MTLNSEAVKTFVVNVLGCGCPESVLQTIEVQKGEAAVSGLSLLSRINIGNRLLIWLVTEADIRSPDHLLSLVQHGVAERNKGGYNRLRIVLLTGGDRREEGELNPLSGGFTPPDEKVHLHIIPKDKVPDSLA